MSLPPMTESNNKEEFISNLKRNEDSSENLYNTKDMTYAGEF